MLQGMTVEVAGRRYQVIGDVGKAMVSSFSQVNGWHVVRDGHCDCESYKYRGTCSHLKALVVAMQPKPAPKPVVKFDEREDWELMPWQPARATVVESKPLTLSDLYDN